ncbi:pseudouridine synthase [Alistipes onderdonkii]|nr:pseudouridine synthase [Alistipes onderdonkii]KAA2427350.1 pseudouridine synthase [Alistipes onderdonkii]KAA2436837.1 pseudouridine synthase [Alistipes onderdonkii]KAA2443392.1 pseudouridine synthase [Alistipes onderdonkii]KAA2461646.1 pseudouridine synthase [Alistipes onderdonkii]
MKDNKHDSTTVLSRFGRDKRQRTVTATAERVERRPRLQRDAADSEQPSSEGPRGRASYNPHFTADNRPAFDKPRRQFGDKPAYGERKSGDKPRYEHRDGDKPRRQFGDKPAYGERKSGDKPRYEHRDGDKPRRQYGDKPAYGERKFGDKPRYEHRDGDKPRRQYGDKPAYGERKFGDKKYGDRKFGDKPYKPGPRKHDDKPASYPKFTPEKQVGEMRLNRFLAQSGLCSRREADDFITAGLVTVNGQIVTQLGTKVLPTDEVKFNDSRVQGEKKVYLVLNKPKGYVTSLDDPHAGKTVMDLVEGACTERIYPVGRLDKNSLGLLLFTNDGDLTKQLTHPSYLKKKIYQVTLDKPLARADMDRIAEGITLEDGEIFADEISYVKENKQEIGIEIHSGRNRIVRRIFEFLGYTVTKLDRVYYAGLTKKNLKRGAWRFLSREEVERLKSGQYE